MNSLLLYFLVGLVVCFIGTIPFGPINLTVVKTTIDLDQRRGMEVALAAALIEIIQALIAISFGRMISAYLDANNLVNVIIAIVFIFLALGVFMRKRDPVLAGSPAAERSFFFRGLLLATLNPQAIPFWIFALAAISQYTVFDYSGGYLIALLGGVFVGKLTALLGFVYTANYLRTHLRQSSRIVNRILAAILLLIGVSQLWNAL